MSVVLDANVLIVLSQPKDTAAVVAMAQRLERRSAYDAAYLVLAEELQTQLWTLDGRLARSTERLKLSTQLTQAEGEDQSRGFLVLENSMGRREKIVMQRGYEQLRDTLIHEGTLVEEGDRIRLVRSYLFDCLLRLPACSQGRQKRAYRVEEYRGPDAQGAARTGSTDHRQRRSAGRIAATGGIGFARAEQPVAPHRQSQVRPSAHGLRTEQFAHEP